MHELETKPLDDLWNTALGSRLDKSKSNLQPGACIELEEWARDWAEGEQCVL